jgi:hypothetical protein
MSVAAVSPWCGNPDAHGALPEAGNDVRMADGSQLVFAQIAPHPGDAIAFHELVRVHHFFDAWNGRDVAANDNDRRGRQAPHHAAHLPDLPDIHDDRRYPTMSYCCVVSSRSKASRVGKSSTGQGAEMFSWINMMVQDRWNIRKENALCSRVTWL